MAANSSIEWTEATWNCLAGCEAISPGCANCYAKTMTRRLEAMGQADYAGLTTDKHFNGKIRCLPQKLGIPLKRKKPTTYFVNSMSDLFHDDVPASFIDAVFAVMAACPQHTFQVLTKRAGRMCDYLRGRDVGKRWWRLMNEYARPAIVEVAEYWTCNGLPNVWLGVSCEDQKRADERIPHLLKTPAAVRFLSCEPLLGPIDLTEHYFWRCAECGRDGTHEWSVCRDHGPMRFGSGIDWVIVGGESGPGARPCNVEWIRGIVQQCKGAGVPCFVKQLGSNPFEERSGQAADLLYPHGKPPGLKIEGEYYHRRDFRLKDRKGGDIAEFPEDLRIRQFPAIASA